MGFCCAVGCKCKCKRWSSGAVGQLNCRTAQGMCSEAVGARQRRRHVMRCRRGVGEAGGVRLVQGRSKCAKSRTYGETVAVAEVRGGGADGVR